MPEDMSVQILSQASENIQKLFDLSTRIDERVKTIQTQHESMDRRVEDINRRQTDILQKIAVLEHLKRDDDSQEQAIRECEDAIRDLDKRLMPVEGAKNRTDDRWNRIASFFIQLIWVILAAYVLAKFNLQAPAVP